MVSDVVSFQVRTRSTQQSSKEKDKRTMLGNLKILCVYTFFSFLLDQKVEKELPSSLPVATDIFPWSRRHPSPSSPMLTEERGLWDSEKMQLPCSWRRELQLA